MDFTEYYSIVLLFIISISDNDWYGDRLKTKGDSNVLTIASGPEKGKPVTVPGCGITSVNGRIVGGTAAKVGQFPWSILLFANGKAFCGGTILNENWIISAAHCFKEKTGIKGVTVKVGMINSDEGTEYQLSKLIKHDKYNSDSMEVNDLALLKTTKPIKSQKDKTIDLVNGICLPNKMEETKSKIVTVSGWGRTGENDDPSRFLRLVNLDIINQKECQKKFATPMVGYPNGYKIYNTQICTWTKNKDACQGDSGGPAIELINGKAYLVGVVSFGVGCATDFPGVLTKASHYLDWIAQNIT